MPRQQAVELVARLRDRLADLQRQRVRQRVELGDHAGAEALHHGQPLGQRHAPPRPAARRAPRRPWRRRWRRRRRRLRRSAGRWPGCGWSAWSWGRSILARGARRAQKVLQHRRIVEGAVQVGVVELRVPLHGGHIAVAAHADRLDHAVSGTRASTTNCGARSLMPWWWMLLATARFDAGVQLGQARAGQQLDVVEVALVLRHVAVRMRLRLLRGDVLVAACRRTSRSAAGSRGRCRTPACRRRRRRPPVRSRSGRARGRRPTRGAAAVSP